MSTVSTEVVILAQGPTRARMGQRELARLPACGNTSILCRTVAQIQKISTWPPTVIAGFVGCASPCFYVGTVKTDVVPAYVDLPRPGNSALTGIARYLERRSYENRLHDRTIVLLGDVVYSWACQEAVFQMSEGYGFVGTKNLALDKGELWGVAWSRKVDDWMMCHLRDALLRVPPFEDDHQPGQLRRWVSGLSRGDMQDHVTKLKHAGAYIEVDDYTHDMDVPHDLVLLPDLSAVAAADDAQHGICWTAPP